MEFKSEILISHMKKKYYWIVGFVILIIISLILLNNIYYMRTGPPHLDYCETDSDCICCDFIESFFGERLHENICVNKGYKSGSELTCGGIESTDSFCYTHGCNCVNNKCEIA